MVSFFQGGLDNFVGILRYAATIDLVECADRAGRNGKDIDDVTKAAVHQIREGDRRTGNSARP